MYQKLLTKKFFRENPVQEMSAPRLVYSYMLYDGLDEIAAEYIKLNKSDEEERKLIAAEENQEVLLKMLRGKISNINRGVLYRKILEHEDEMVPEIIGMLQKSINDVFIENAVKLLVKFKNNYSDVLFRMLNEIRSDYAQSLVCLVLGLKADEDVIPCLYSKYHYFKKAFNNESYAEGALIALHELNARFYLKAK